MLCVEHHAQIQELGFLVGELPVRAQGVEDGFRRGVARLVGVEKHTLLVEVAALDLIGVGHDRGHPGD